MKSLKPGEYEYRVITIGSEITRNEARDQLTKEAEYGHWELARSRWYIGGVRKVWLRRRIMRVKSTL